MTNLPPDFASDAVTAIRSRLDLARRQGVIILFAIESGSRAWGFPSPDSDYDYRFVYAHRPAEHLVLQQPRDVMEFPIEGDIDAGGWDLRKALLLALSGNAVVVEWAKSPYVYEEIPGFRTKLKSLLDTIVPPWKVAHHYLGLTRAHISRSGNLTGTVKLKKLFYLIRPLVALDWMERGGFVSLPPMSLPECMSDIVMPDEARKSINALIERKKQTREIGVGSVPPAIASYLEARYGHHEMTVPKHSHDPASDAARRAAAEQFYRETVEGLPA